MEVLAYSELVRPPESLVAPIGSSTKSSSSTLSSSPPAEPKSASPPPPASSVSPPESPAAPEGSSPSIDAPPPTAAVPSTSSNPVSSSPPSSSQPSQTSPAVSPPPSGSAPGSPPRTPRPPGNYDRYGFSVGEAVASDAVLFFRSAKSRTAQVEKEMQRVGKWLEMMNDWERWKSKRGAKIRGRIRKGIPDRVRGKAWQLIAGSHGLSEQHPGLYDKLCEAHCALSDEIGRDISRTFPTHETFRDNPQLATSTLHNVLKAFAVYDPEVGYCQGMGFVAALLIFYMPEEQAFWMLTRLLSPRYNMAGLFRPGLPLVLMHTWQLERLLERRHPKMVRHLTKEGILISGVTTKWFLTNFAYTFPFATTIRIWDIYLNEGVKIVFRVSLALFDALKPTIMKSRMEDLYALFADIPVKFLGPDRIIDAALAIRLKGSTLDKLALAYQESVHADEATRSRRASRRIIPSATPLEPSSSSSKS